MNKLFSLLTVSIALMLGSCFTKKATDDTASRRAECPEDVLCTMDFRSFALQVVDVNDRPVLLDTYRTLVDGKEVKLSKFADEAVDLKDFKGFYTIADDGNMELLGKKGKEITFIGLRGGSEVVRHTVVLGHDCCHIQLKSGSQKVIVK